MDLTVKLMSGECRPLQVSSGATVADLQRLVSQSFNVPEARVRLSTNTGQLDNRLATLSSYGLNSGSTIMLLILQPLQVVVKNEKGQNKTYEMNQEDTVADLQRQVYKTEKISEDQQRLIYNGKQLEPGLKLRDYNIQTGSTVYLTLRLRGG